MLIDEIVLGKDENSRREAIQKNLGKQVILKDDHQGWVHGKILTEGYDAQVYLLHIGDGRGVTQMHYHDLEKSLFILRGDLPDLGYADTSGIARLNIPDIKLP